MTGHPSALIIASEASMQSHIGALLEGMGFHVSALSLEQWESLATQGNDLTVCSWEDWAASGKGSAQEHLAKSSPPLIFYSRCPEEDTWMQALKAGAFDLVEEPHSEESTHEFCRVVNAAVRKHALARPVREVVAV